MWRTRITYWVLPQQPGRRPEPCSWSCSLVLAPKSCSGAAQVPAAVSELPLAGGVRIGAAGRGEGEDCSVGCSGISVWPLVGVVTVGVSRRRSSPWS